METRIMNCKTCKEELIWIPDERGWWCIDCQSMRILE